MRKPSSAGIPAAIVKRLRTVRYAVGDLLGLVGRTLADVGRYLLAFPVAAGRGAARFWRSLSLIARRRLVAAVGAAALLLILFGAVVPNLPCQLPGGDSCPPADDAEQVVPADALAYLRANLDPESDQFAAAAEIGEQLPALGGQLSDRALGLVAGAGGEPLEFDRIEPWFADDAAVAVLAPSTGPPQRVELFEVSDGDGAREYAASIAVGEVQTSEYEGVEVSVDQRDVATAQAGGFLVIGTEDGVQEVIATATGADGAESLADERGRDRDPRPAPRPAFRRGLALRRRDRGAGRRQRRSARDAGAAGGAGGEQRARRIAERRRRRARARGPQRARLRGRRSRLLRRLPAVRADPGRAVAPRDPRLSGDR